MKSKMNWGKLRNRWKHMRRASQRLSARIHPDGPPKPPARRTKKRAAQKEEDASRKKDEPNSIDNVTSMATTFTTRMASSIGEVTL